MIILFKALPIAMHPPVPITGTGWVAGDDYPAAALRIMEQGVTSFRLDASKTGLPLKCEIERSSGYADLDVRTCAILMRRARFEPATHKDGTPVAGSYSSKTNRELHEAPAPSKSN